MGVRQEEWFLQETPQGGMIIVRLEADDPAEALARWAMSQNSFDCWFKAQAGQVCGLDFNQPLSGLPEQVLHWSAR
jgi:hypothetical protein